jgi:hypothetical protein
MARTHWAARRASAPSDTHDGLGTIGEAIVDDAGFSFAEASCE